MLDEDKRFVLADMTEPGQEVVLAKGGDGGFGNLYYKSSVTQSPRKAIPGWPGEERWVWLRLKLIADAGLIGLPNAGKSTFLAASSAARPKIADYPFTTLVPNLGVVRLDNEREFVLADIPGLIEGAHEGAGIGDRFLGHVERCQALVHLVDGAGLGDLGLEDVAAAYKVVREELIAYGGDLADKTEILALNKTDALDDETAARPGARRTCGSRRVRARRCAPDLWCRWHRCAGGGHERLWKAIGRDRNAPLVDDVPEEDSGGTWSPRMTNAGPLQAGHGAPGDRQDRLGPARRRSHWRNSAATGWLVLADDLAAMRGPAARTLASSPPASIALGRRKLGLPSGALRLEESQAAAAVGQIDLAHAYRSVFAPHGFNVAQLLLTLSDTEERRRYLNARGTLATLFRLGAIPVINENDTVATEEIRFGDNDRLAARVAACASADALVQCCPM